MRKTMGAMIVAAVCGVGCGAAVPPVPSKGGPAWTELTSEHFTVWTDAAPAQARELVRKMEHLRRVVVGLAFRSLPAGGRVLVIALRDDKEFAAFAPSQDTAAYASPAQPPLWQPLIVLSEPSDQQGNLTVAHELTHAISFGVIHHQPRWLSEGMGEFFETVALDPDATSVAVGAPPSYRGQSLQRARFIPVAALLQWKKIGEDEHSQYSTAWALFTYLMNEHYGELAQYMQLVDVEQKSWGETTQADAERMWSAAFPSLPLDKIDTTLRRWVIGGQHTTLHFNVAPRPSPIAERALGDGDVHAVRALLHLHVERKDLARAEAAAALVTEATNPLARMLLAVSEHELPTPDEGRAVAAAHPADWRAWLVAALAISGGHGDPADAEAARAKACSLSAHNPAVVPPPELCPRQHSSP